MSEAPSHQAEQAAYAAYRAFLACESPANAVALNQALLAYEEAAFIPRIAALQSCIEYGGTP